MCAKKACHMSKVEGRSVILMEREVEGCGGRRESFVSSENAEWRRTDESVKSM